MQAYQRMLQSRSEIQSIRGKIIHGDKLGRTIGFPTANMHVHGHDKPAYGIYASRVILADGRVFHAATNFGIRPTFSPPKELLETYIFDFAEDIYGEEIEVELVHFLRREEKFDGLSALISQMTRDCDAARTILIREPID
jgi:riboflavin kinase/FMN adenylyltransferase